MFVAAAAQRARAGARTRARPAGLSGAARSCRARLPLRCSCRPPRRRRRAAGGRARAGVCSRAFPSRPVAAPRMRTVRETGLGGLCAAAPARHLGSTRRAACARPALPLCARRAASRKAEPRPVAEQRRVTEPTRRARRQAWRWSWRPAAPVSPPPGRGCPPPYLDRWFGWIRFEMAGEGCARGAAGPGAPTRSPPKLSPPALTEAGEGRTATCTHAGCCRGSEYFAASVGRELREVP